MYAGLQLNLANFSRFAATPGAITSAAISAALSVVTDGFGGFNVATVLGTAADGRGYQLIASGVGSGSNSFLNNLSGMTTTGGDIFQTRTFVGQNDVRIDVGSTATFVLTSDHFIRLGFASGTPAFPTGDINQALVYRGHVANESVGGTILDAVTYDVADYDFEDGNGATGTMTRTTGLRVKQISHATKVTQSAYGVYVVDQTEGPPIAAAYGTDMESGTGKYVLYSIGTAPSSHRGAMRVGFVGAPGTPVFDGQYQPGTLASGATNASQFYAEPTNGHSGGTSNLTNVLFRINASGTNNVNTYTTAQNKLDIANTSGTIANLYGTLSGINIVPASGSLAVTSIRNIAPTFSFTGTGGTTSTASFFYAGAPNFSSGTHAVTTLKGLNIDDIGHATRVTNAIGIDIANITASATLTAGIRSVMNSGTGKWFIQHTGTAASTFGGDVTVTGALTAPNVPRVIAASGTASSVTTGTSETQLASITIPANTIGANGALRITTFWSHTNGANNKTLRVRFGGSGGIAYYSQIVTTTAATMDQRTIYANNSTSAQKGFQSTASFGSTSTAVATGAVNTTSSTTVYISGQTATSGDTITLEGYSVELIPGV